MCQQQHRAGAEVLEMNVNSHLAEVPIWRKNLSAKTPFPSNVWWEVHTTSVCSDTLRKRKGSSKRLHTRGHPRGPGACPQRGSSVHIRAPDPASPVPPSLPSLPQTLLSSSSSWNMAASSCAGSFCFFCLTCSLGRPAPSLPSYLSLHITSYGSFP